MIRMGTSGRSVKTSRAYFARNVSISGFGFRKGGEEFALLIPRKGIAYGIHVGEQTRIAVENIHLNC